MAPPHPCRSAPNVDPPRFGARTAKPSSALRSLSVQSRVRGVRSRCPHRAGACPRPAVPRPKRAGGCPRRAVACPQRAVARPRPAVPCPQRAGACPRRALRYPGGAAAFPRPGGRKGCDSRFGTGGVPQPPAPSVTTIHDGFVGLKLTPLAFVLASCDQSCTVDSDCVRVTESQTGPSPDGIADASVTITCTSVYTSAGATATLNPGSIVCTGAAIIQVVQPSSDRVTVNGNTMTFVVSDPGEAPATSICTKQ